MESGVKYPLDLCDTNSSLNVSEGVDIENFYYLNWEWIPTYAIKPCLLVIGLLCNFTFLLVCIRVPYMHTLSNIFLANLAITDLLYLGVSIGYSVDSFSTLIRQDLGTFGNAGCYITYFAFWFCYFSSMLLLTVACFEQFMAVCCPDVHEILLNSRLKSAIFTLFASGFAAALSGVFQLLFDPLQTYCILVADSNEDQDVVNATLPNLVKINLCYLDNDYLRETQHIIRLSFWAFASLSCIVMFIVIYVTFGRRDKAVEENANADVDNYRNPVVFMLLISTIVTLIAWIIPCIQDVMSILYLTGYTAPLTPTDRVIVSHISSLSTLLMSTLKPIVYSATHWRYRGAYGQVFEMFSFGSRLKRNKSMRGGLTKSVKKH